MSFYLCIFYEANTFGNETEEIDLDTSKWLQKPSGAKVLNWLSYPAGCYYAVSSFLNFLQMKYVSVILFR